jgi:hypothetical protein
MGVRGQQIFAAEIANHAMARAAVIPVGLDQADVFIDRSVGPLDLGGAKAYLVVLCRQAH